MVTKGKPSADQTSAYRLLIGAHMSIAGGIHKAFERGRRIGCQTIQVFLKNANQWKAKRLTEKDKILFLQWSKAGGICPVLAHNSYLINLASPNRILYRKSIRALIEEMERADFLGIGYLILHPGSHMGSGLTAGIARIAGALNLALESVGPPVKLLLETTAGQGTGIGHRFEHLAAIVCQLRSPERVGICLDTCHIFAAGYDIRTEQGYVETLQELDRMVGIKKVVAVHVNDSRGDLGCRVDRHFHIGRGAIGLEAFRLIMNDPCFATVPKILETPKDSGLRADRRNLRVLKSLVAHC